MSKEKFLYCESRRFCIPDNAVQVLDPAIPSCILSSYFNHSLDLKFCDMVLVRTRNIYPYSIKISSKQYLIVTTKTISFTISCGPRVDREVVAPPMGILQMHRGCRATSSNLLILSGSVLNTTTINTDSFVKFEFHRSEIWNFVKSKLGDKFKFLGTELKKITANKPVDMHKIG